MERPTVGATIGSGLAALATNSLGDQVTVDGSPVVWNTLECVRESEQPTTAKRRATTRFPRSSLSRSFLVRRFSGKRTNDAKPTVTPSNICARSRSTNRRADHVLDVRDNQSARYCAKA